MGNVYIIQGTRLRTDDKINIIEYNSFCHTQIVYNKNNIMKEFKYLKINTKKEKML